MLQELLSNTKSPVAPIALAAATALAAYALIRKNNRSNGINLSSSFPLIVPCSFFSLFLLFPLPRLVFPVHICLCVIHLPLLCSFFLLSSFPYVNNLYYKQKIQVKKILKIQNTSVVLKKRMLFIQTNTQPYPFFFFIFICIKTAHQFVNEYTHVIPFYTLSKSLCYSFLFFFSFLS